MTPSHVRSGRCPACGKFRPLNAVRRVPTEQNKDRQQTRAKSPVRSQRVCAACGAKERAA